MYCVNHVDNSSSRRHDGHMTTDGGPLRAARTSLGWSQGRAATELAALATRRGLAVASPVSLKTQLSRWENQHVVPEDTYRVLLRELYGRTDEELGLTAGEPIDDLDEAELLLGELAVAAAVDDGGLDLLETQLAATMALDDRLGSVAVADSVQAQLSHLERVLAHAISTNARERLARLVGSASMLAGTVAADQRLPASAWRHFDRAGLVSRDAGDTFLARWAMVEQARLLVELGRAPAALELLEHARQRGSAEESPLVRGWLTVNRGDVLAATGAAEQALAAYRDAQEVLKEARTSTPAPPKVDIGYPAAPFLVFDDAALYRHRGHGLHILRDHEQAIVDLELALSTGEGSAREVAALHVDLAHAFSATDDQASAQSHARTARELATRIGSSRLSSRLDSGFAQVAPTASPVFRTGGRLVADR
jgi:tetratricopeptide (TPR) repeat protein